MPIEMHCELCGKSVRRKASELRYSPHVYCSRKCSNMAQSAILRQHPELRDCAGIEVKCRQCGKAFFVKPFRVTTAKFCSKACFFAHRFGRPLPQSDKDISGAKNPNYRGTSNQTTARLLAFAHFARRCMICGFDIVVDVHHIHPRRHNGTNALANLAVLCPNHHAMADRGFISKDELTRLALAAIAQELDPQPQFDLPEPCLDENDQPSP